MPTPAEINAFAVLGVPVSVTEMELRLARRLLVRANHPDLVQNNRAATDRRLAQINTAFDLAMTVLNARGPRSRPNPGPANPSQSDQSAPSDSRSAAAPDRASDTPTGTALVALQPRKHRPRTIRDPGRAAARRDFEAALSIVSTGPARPQRIAFS